MVRLSRPAKTFTPNHAVLCKSSKIVVNGHPMASGAKLGERRGGRKKGTPNRITFMKTQMAMKAMVESAAANGTSRAVDVLGRIVNEALSMAMTYGPSSAEYDDDLYRNYLKLTVYTASRLAPYQSPQLVAMRVGSDRDSPLVIREGVTSKEVFEMLRQKMQETGLVPSQFVDVTPEKTKEGVSGNGKA
jgi:hypothetical protein